MYSPPEPDFNYKRWRNRMLLLLVASVLMLIVGCALWFGFLPLR